MKPVIQQIEEITVVISISGGRREVCYHVPTGINGDSFLSFKIRNKSLIEYLKSLTNEKQDEKEELKSGEADNIPLQPRSQEGFSDNLNLQEIRFLGERT